MIRKLINPRQVLFICAGNTCRSPMAEYIFRDMASEAGLNIKSESRGTYIQNRGCYAYSEDNAFGGLMNTAAVAAVQHYNPNIKGMENHYSRSFTDADLNNSGLILAMTESIRDSVIGQMKKMGEKTLRAENSVERKVFTLKEYAGICGKGDKTSYDVQDPVAGAPARPPIGFEPYREEHYWVNRTTQYMNCKDEIVGALRLIVAEFNDPIKRIKKMWSLKGLVKARQERNRVMEEERNALMANRYGGVQPYYASYRNHDPDHDPNYDLDKYSDFD